ncbi:MAG: hypothetical protein JKY98_00140, partial [Gammaproteobacteria bacterium]|nr:hypothetical protein [Gammaproteobacteria bacterium]
MSSQTKKLKIHLSADLDFTNVFIDASYLWNLLGSFMLDAVKSGGFDDIDPFNISEDGDLEFAEGINFTTVDFESGKFTIQFKGDDGKQKLQIEFVNASDVILELDDSNPLISLSSDWDGERLQLGDIDPDTIESIHVNDDRFHVVQDESGDYLLKLNEGEFVTEQGSLALTFTVATDDGVFADTLTLEALKSDPNVLVGAGQDGYIEGALVWADNNEDRVFNDGVEASDLTDALGSFSLEGNTTGTLNLMGGTDVATKLTFEGRMLAPEGSTVITPITTLIDIVAEEGSLNTASAESAIKAAFGLDVTIDLTFYDSIRVLAEATTAADIFAAANVFAVGSTILNAATVAGKLLEGSSGSVSFLEAEKAVYTALANLILLSGTIDLTDAGTVETIINNAATALGFTAPDSADAATIISDINTLIDTATPDFE